MARKTLRRDITDEEYRRMCTLESPAFRKDKETFLNHWKHEDDLFAEPIVVACKAERGAGIEAIKDQQRRQGEFMAELIELCHKWPSITPGDVQGAPSSVPGPKVRLAPYSPRTWPRDGSVLLSVDPTTTGDEIKRQWQNIKKALGRRSQRQGASDRALKLRIYKLYQARAQSGARPINNFSEIARIVKKKRSTVVGLYDSVYKDIHGIKPKSIRRLTPDFKFADHFSSCLECQTKGICALANDELTAQLRQPGM
jgi:hypothetical protein